MYTIRIINDGEKEHESKLSKNLSGEDIAKEFADRVNAKLKEYEISVRLSPFPGRDDLFLLTKAEKQRKSDDKRLSFSDWKFLNDAVNDMLDELRLFAIVKSSKFVVRYGFKRRVDYSGGRRLR